MSVAPHDRFRDRLRVVDRGRGAVEALVEVGLIPGPAHAWACTFARFAPWDDAWATLLIERADPQRIILVRLRADPPGAPLGPLGHAELRSFPDDRRLPALAVALRRLEATEVVRYRPALRCTFRSSAFGGSFGKIFADPRAGARIHAEGALLAQASERGVLAFDVARPLRYDPLTRATLQSRVAGAATIGPLLGAEGEALAARMGEAAATLARLDGRPQLVLDRPTQLGKSRANAIELGRRVPGLADSATQLVEAIAAVHGSVPVRPLVPIHGGLHPHQWLDDDGRLGLVDFDGLALGEVELDMANFMAEVDFERSAVVGPARLNEAFRAGFESVAGPADDALLAAYRAEKRLSKALRSARALRPDGDEAATRHLARAHEALAARR